MLLKNKNKNAWKIPEYSYMRCETSNQAILSLRQVKTLVDNIARPIFILPIGVEF